MWSFGGSPPQYALNFEGAIADTIRAVPVWGDGGIYRIFYTHEAPECTPLVPFVDIKANGSDGPITIPYNTAATISWTSSNASSCSVSPTGWTGTSGSQSTGNLTSSQTYTLSCTGPGGSASDNVTVNVSPPPPIVTLTANDIRPQIRIAEGQSVNLNWTSTNVNPNGCTASGGSPGWPGSNYPAQDQTSAYTYTLEFGIYTYTIQCAGPGGASEPSSVIVDVIRPILTLSIGSKTCVVVNLNWSWNDPWFNTQFSQYRIFRSDDNGATYNFRGQTNQMTYQDQDTFTSDKTYFYRLEAQRPAGASVTSNAVPTVPCPRLPTWCEIHPGAPLPQCPR
jgi:hypothetical protein